MMSSTKLYPRRQAASFSDVAYMGLLTSVTPISPNTSMDTFGSALMEKAGDQSALLATHMVPPPPSNVKTPSGEYVPEESAMDDLPGVTYALDLFLASHMVESEEFCHQMDPPKRRLYYATGYGLIQCVKALMSFEDEDLLDAIGHTKHGNTIASQHRKRVASLPTRLAGLVIGSLNTSGVGWIKSMTPVERHAELTYAESLFEKALLGIVYSGDWLAFVKEALNMRTIVGIYRQLGKYIEVMDAEAQARGEGPEDKSIDIHFRSGVYLGNGICHLILSLMPGKILTIIEMFGYKGDRMTGLEYLARSGGWTKDSREPSVSAEKEGVRRSICDMGLLIFHLILSSFTFEGVDVPMAQKILDWNSKRYPNGVFFLFGQGRLSLVRSQPKKAIEYYQRAMEVQNQYRNLHLISFWEMATANLALWDIPASLECWKILKAEATWSKACYAFGMAICLLQLGGEERNKEAARLFAEVPDLRQRIAGKSIPLEKFIARRAKKFQEQKNRLTLPALELAYVFMGIAHAPRGIILSKMLPQVDAELAKIKPFENDPHKYEGGQAYWDDLCLVKFLEGVCLRYIAYPDVDAVLDPAENVAIEKSVAEARAKKAFETVFDHGLKIKWDHHLVYHAHYELGRLLVCAGDLEGGRTQLELVYSGKPLEVNQTGRKGKYSMENALHMRVHAALEGMKTNRL